MELTAKPIQRQRKIKGIALESLVDSAAVLVAVFGALIAFAALATLGFPGLLTSVAIAFGSFLNWLLFRALAEVIRLLKRNTGIEYAGRISGTYYDLVPTCNNCGAMLHSTVSCDGCGARLLRPEESDSSPEAE